MTEARRCVVCPVRRREPEHYEQPQACPSCRTWLAGVLRDIAETYPLLAAALTPRRNAGQRVAGSREAPLPVVVDVIDLTSPVRIGLASDEAKRWAEDQVGHTAVRARLESWAQDWISHDWCRSDHLPLPTVPALAGWLGTWLDDACDHHGAIDEFAGEMLDVLGSIRAYVPRVVDEHHRARPAQRTVPCPSCGAISLWWFPADERVRCDNPDCGRVLTADEYDRWTGQKVAYARQWRGLPDPCPHCERPIETVEADVDKPHLLRFEPCGHTLDTAATARRVAA